jgi:hypothetical protein
MEPKPYFHLSFRPNIKLVSTVRRFTADFYRRVLANQELSDRLALATHELLENAVAYSVDNETAIRIEIDEGERIVIKTWNRTTYERAAAVRSAIEELNDAPDPDKYYQETMLKMAKRTDGSGLGLARIRAEADMSLRCEVDKDRVCIHASAQIHGGLNP